MTPKEIPCSEKSDCPHKNKKTGNCSFPSTEDGLVVQCVNPWVEDKYYYLDNYLSATRFVRKGYSDRNNAVFIDLFAGPGRCRIKKSKKELPVGPLRIVDIDYPFNRIIANDIEIENYTALSSRIKDADIYNRDTNDIIEKITDDLLKSNYKLHFVFLDPYAPKNLKFHVLKSLSKLDHVDILMNFPIYGIRINYDQWLAGNGNILDEFLGTDQWREIVGTVTKDQFCNTILYIYTEQLINIGFPQAGLGLIGKNGESYKGPSIVTIKNSNNSPLYYLLLISKNALAAKMWNSITKIDHSGQRGLYS